MTIPYKTIVRVFCFVCAAMLAMLGVVISNVDQTMRYRRQLESSYLYSLQAAAGGMNALTADLKKSAYAGTPAQAATYSANIYKQSGAVKTALAGLPETGGNLEEAFRFLSQVGEYSQYLSRKAALGEAATEEERQNMEMLTNYAVSMALDLKDIESRVASGGWSTNDLLAATAAAADTPGVISAKMFAGMSGSFEGYPTLIYDGPFSDHILTHEPYITKTMPEISREKAREIAAAYTGVAAGELSDEGDEDSSMPSYCFSGGGYSAGVTKNGGFVTYVLSSRMPGEKKLALSEGRNKAREYLDKTGAADMKETYYELAAGVLTVNYAFAQDGVVCYTDLIKVGVAMDTGEIVFYDARGFINNHRERGRLSPKISAAKAVENVSESLDAQSYALALIPTAGKNEALTWEFRCKGFDDENVLVYINAESGAEENILILIETENGTLTI